MNLCIDCGNVTGGIRCKPCNGKQTARVWAESLASQDAALLAEVAAGLTAQRLGIRMNRSRQWADRTIKKAKRRQGLLANLANPT